MRSAQIAKVALRKLFIYKRSSLFGNYFRFLPYWQYHFTFLFSK